MFQNLILVQIRQMFFHCLQFRFNGFRVFRQLGFIVRLLGALFFRRTCRLDVVAEIRPVFLKHVLYNLIAILKFLLFLGVIYKQ